MNIPNLITVLRVLLIPIFILLFYLPYEWSYVASSSVFAFAAACSAQVIEIRRLSVSSRRCDQFARFQ